MIEKTMSGNIPGEGKRLIEWDKNRKVSLLDVIKTNYTSYCRNIPDE